MLFGGIIDYCEEISVGRDIAFYMQGLGFEPRTHRFSTKKRLL